MESLPVGRVHSFQVWVTVGELVHCMFYFPWGCWSSHNKQPALADLQLINQYLGDLSVITPG